MFILISAVILLQSSLIIVNRTTLLLHLFCFCMQSRALLASLASTRSVCKWIASLNVSVSILPDGCRLIAKKSWAGTRLHDLYHRHKTFFLETVNFYAAVFILIWDILSWFIWLRTSWPIIHSVVLFCIIIPWFKFYTGCHHKLCSVVTVCRWVDFYGAHFGFGFAFNF